MSQPQQPNQAQPVSQPPQGVSSPQPRQVSPQEAFNNSLKAQENQLKQILPPHVPIEKFIRIVMTAVIKSPKLLEANRTSLFSACHDAAKDGLLPDGKESALVPFFDKNSGQAIVTYIPMIGGILKKIRNSGELGAINSHEIHANDQFKYFIDEKGPHLMHEPNFMGGRGDFIGAYALAIMKDGGIYLEVMTKEQIESIRKRSRGGESGPWKTDYVEMAKKTVTRRLAKRLPSSTDIESYFHDENEFESITEKTPAVALAAPVQELPAPIPAAEVGPTKLKAAIKAKSTPVIAPKDEPPPINFDDVPI